MDRRHLKCLEYHVYCYRKPLLCILFKNFSKTNIARQVQFGPKFSLGVKMRYLFCLAYMIAIYLWLFECNIPYYIIASLTAFFAQQIGISILFTHVR